MAAPIDLWLKAHGAGERALARDLAGYFSDQAERIAGKLADVDNPTLANVAGLLDEADETAALLDVVMPHIAQLTSAGAEAILKKYRTKKTASGLYLLKADELGFESYDPAKERDPADYIPDSLPEYMYEGILKSLGKLEEQPYWKAIQAGTNEQISMVIGKGIEDGINGKQMAKLILKELGGDAAKTRAEAIARTETTGAMNAGHQVGYEDLAEDGLITGKTWLSVSDDRTRESHDEMNDETVGVKDKFSNGSDYPGDPSLPAEERVNCRCTTIAAIADV